MKRFILILAAFVMLSTPALAIGGTAAAANVFKPCSGNAASTDVCEQAKSASPNNGTNNPIVDFIRVAINILSYIIGAAAIIGILVSSIKFMTAGGDSQAVASARSALIYSLIGIAIVVLAQAIVAFVLNKVQ